MNSLEVIVKRNEEAAGRAAAHAVNDDNETLAHKIAHADLEVSDTRPILTFGFRLGFCAGLQEG